MALAFIPFKDFAPGGDSMGDRLADAKNVIPLFGGYHPLRARVNAAVVADHPILGAHVHTFPTGLGTSSYLADAARFYAGSRAKLYTVTPSAWTDVSRAAGPPPYAAAGEPAGWRFASYGDDVWACNALNTFQRHASGAATFVDGPTSTFVPKPRFCGVVREAMIVADLSANGAGFYADQFTWSDFNDATWYDDKTGTRAASVAGGSLGKRIRSRPGQITGFIGGEYGRFFKRRSIHAIQLTGGNDVWRLDEISPKIGCMFPSSLIDGEDGAYFFSGRRFYRQDGQNPPEPISTPEIEALFTDGIHYGDKGFFHAAMSAPSQEDNLMVGVEDWRTGIKFWFYTAGFTLFPSSTPLNAAVCYDPQSGAWSRLTESDLAGGLEFMRGVPYPENGTELSSKETVRMIFFSDDGSSNSQWSSFSGEHEAGLLETKRQSLVFDQLSPSGHYQIQAVLPVFTVPETSSWSDTVQPPVPVPAVTVAIQASNDMHFASVADADGAVINPRSAAYSQANADDWGWLSEPIAGRFFDVSLAFPAGAEWRNCQGVWVYGDPVGVTG